MSTTFDLIVIGAGPGGYVAAIRAAQLGLKVACVEKQYLGGTCLNVGCIPSKALLDSSERYHYAKHSFSKHGIKVDNIGFDLSTMMARKNDVVNNLTNGVGFLFKKNKITHLQGLGKIVAPGKVEVAGTVYECKNILIATGSSPIQIGSLPFDGKHILSSTEALTLDKVPEKMLIVGGGYIGVEIGSVWSRLGAQVTIVEFTDGILPASDREMAGALLKMLTKQGITFMFKTGAQKAVVEGGKVKVTVENADTKQASELVVDKVMVAVGRRPVTDGLGLETVGVKTSKRGFVEVDDHYQTSVPGIYAIGDVIGKIMLAHNAEEEGVAAAEIIVGKPGHVSYDCCPSVVYTHPELAAVGLTEEQAKEKFGQIKVGKFNLVANGRARGMDETEGFVKVIGDAKTDRLLGCHILSAHASDMIAECTIAMEFKSSVEDLARSFHAHPTLPEAIKEAALAADGRVIHS
jgi:dihydrolipoamide dehydrogenase